VLGLGELRQRIQQEVGELAEIVTEGKTPSEEALVRVAGVLLSVEDSLDDQLVRLILPASEDPLERSRRSRWEFRQVSEAVLRECIVNLARIKEAVTLAVQKPADFSPQGLDNVPQLLRGIAAGLLMLGKHRAVDFMEAIGTEVRKLIEPGAPAPDALRLGTRGRRNRQHRVLHGDAAERPHRSLVHAGQRRNLPQGPGG
jgi:chemosensory pili system protein ChpA (sensor histidine kinase/response regulator)